MPTSKPNEFAWNPPQENFSTSVEAQFLSFVGVASFEELEYLARQEPSRYWRAVLDFGEIPFLEPYTKVLDDSQGPAWSKWCVGGKANLTHICVDRWRDTPVWEKEFLVWEGEQGTVRRLTYAQFGATIARAAAGLAQRGISAGDVVALYLPLIPEALIAYFAIIKLGAIVLPLFSGYSAPAIRQRLELAKVKAIVTADGMVRRGMTVPMKPVVDAARTDLPTSVLSVVINQLGNPPAVLGPNDVDWNTLIEGQAEEYPTAETAADAPCVLHYTSGTTGKPKGCVYTHIGPAAKMVLDHGILNGFGRDDRHFCMADMGWMVGTKLAVLPAVHGASLLIADGAPDYPDPGRFWRLLDTHQATFAELSPSLVRLMMAHGDDVLAGRDFSKIRGLITGGEPWTDTAWNWLFTKVCRSQAPIYDSAGGTEVSGSILLCDMLHPIKAGSFSVAVPGMGASVAMADGTAAKPGTPGELVMDSSSIGLTQGLWNDRDRYMENYWAKIPGLWVHGDLASKDDDGYWQLHGRSDDTFKVAGRRVGPAEIENVIMATGKFREAAAVARTSAEGTKLVVICVPLATDAVGDCDSLVRTTIAKSLGKPFRPDAVLQVADLPKTRNGKIMRRAAKAALNGEQLQDNSALLNPEAMDAIQHAAKALDSVPAD